MMKTDKFWCQWGESDPYFAVYTNSDYRRETLERNRADFFMSGHKHFEFVVNTIEDHFGPLKRYSALDFGCGVGRILIPMAECFERTTGLDISQAMLDEAAQNCAAFGQSNVKLQISDDELSMVNETFDLVHSFVVLHHIPPSRGYRIIDRLLALVRPGGAIFIQTTVRKALPFLTNAERVLRRTKYVIPGAYRAFNVLQSRKWSDPLMPFYPYDLPTIIEIFKRNGFASTVVVADERRLHTRVDLAAVKER